MFADDEIDAITWKTKTFNLSKGTHLINITFSAILDDDDIDLRALLLYIKIIGTQYASHECSSCPYGSSIKASSECEACKQNTYLENKICKNCTDEKYSMVGSVGKQSCVKRQRCEEDDYKVVFTDCENHKRTKFYK